MTQVSRPFQIALVAVVVLAGVWFFALKGGSSSSPSSSSPSSSSSSPTASGAEQEKRAAEPSHVDHGPHTAPGLEGLTRDINKAHGAVAQSQQSARHVEEKAAQASGASGSASGASAPSSAPAKTSSTPSAPAGAAAGSATKSAEAPATKSGTQTTTPKQSSGEAVPPAVPAQQARVEAALKEGRVAVVLFWDPSVTEDKTVHLSVQVISRLHQFFEPQQLPEQHGVSGKIAVFEGPASEVADYGTFTQTAEVFQTPTILIVNTKGQITTVPGFTDAYALEQRINESRRAAH
jgi:hypothetical protein